MERAERWTQAPLNSEVIPLFPMQLLLFAAPALAFYADFLSDKLASYRALHPNHACAVFKHAPSRIPKPSYPEWIAYERGFLDFTLPHVAYCIPRTDYGSWLKVNGDGGPANWRYDAMYFLRQEDNKILLP